MFTRSEIDAECVTGNVEPQLDVGKRLTAVPTLVPALGVEGVAGRAPIVHRARKKLGDNRTDSKDCNDQQNV